MKLIDDIGSELLQHTELEGTQRYQSVSSYKTIRLSLLSMDTHAHAHTLTHTHKEGEEKRFLGER